MTVTRDAAREDDPASDGGRSLLAAPIDPLTYRSLAYLLLAFPLAVGYVVVLSLGLGLTLGFSITLLGPVVAVTFLLSIVALAWLDGRLTAAMLSVDVDPGFPETEQGLAAFVRSLVFGRSTWLGLLYLAWKVGLGLVGFVVIVVGVTLATSLALAPLYYGEHLVVQVGPLLDPFAIDTLPRALAAAGVGVLVALGTLYLTNLFGRASGVVAEGLLDG